MSGVPFPVVTAMVASSSAEVFAAIAALYLPVGCRVADVTYGRGVFWRRIPRGRYRLVASDIVGGVDFKDLPYENEEFDAVVLDPPYMSRGGGWKSGGPGRGYRNVISDQHTILKDYIAGAREARRVLKVGGVLVLKCQDAVEHGKQHWMALWLIQSLEQRGFEVEDLFIMVRKGKPPMRHKTQVHARKNHSYFLVTRKRR